MDHNYKDMGLPDGMMGEPHSHSDGDSMAEVNAHHAAMTAGVGSSEEQYDGTSKSDEYEGGSAKDHNGPDKESMRYPPSNTGRAVRD